MLERGICPACGIHQKHLQHAAQEHAVNGQCVLCSSEEGIGGTAPLAALQSQLSEKLKAQRAIDEQRRTLRARLENLRADEEKLTANIAEIRARIETTSLLQGTRARSEESPTRLKEESPARLKTKLADAQLEEARLRAEFQSSQRRLERSYSRFRTSIAERINLLRELYQEYATAFLGHDCSLEEIPNENRLLSLNQFVPKFNGVVRVIPESCSEAQQFFLDIALRMAFIDLAGSLAGASGSFFCETPENALDLSYVDNVAKMFVDFASKNHALLLTANIQRAGLVQKLLKDASAQEFERRVLKLLDIGHLSDVQKRARKELDRYSK